MDARDISEFENNTDILVKYKNYLTVEDTLIHHQK